MVLSRTAGVIARLVSDWERPGPSWKMAADDITGSWDGARRTPGEPGRGSRDDREEASLSEGELREESDEEPVEVAAAMENMVTAGGGPIPRQPGKRPLGLPSMSFVCVPVVGDQVIGGC